MNEYVLTNPTKVELEVAKNLHIENVPTIYDFIYYKRTSNIDTIRIILPKGWTADDFKATIARANKTALME